MTYFSSSVSGLSKGSQVQVFGIQIGTVTDVKLIMLPGHTGARARVAFELQPERVFAGNDQEINSDPEQVTTSLVRQGMRAVLESSSLITGQKAVSLEFVPNAPDVAVIARGRGAGAAQPGRRDRQHHRVAERHRDQAGHIPFEEIGKNLNDALRSVAQTVSGPDVKNALHKLSDTLGDVQHLVRHADQGLDAGSSACRRSAPSCSRRSRAPTRRSAKAATAAIPISSAASRACWTR